MALPPRLGLRGPQAADGCESARRTAPPRASCWPTQSWLMAPAATSRPSVTPEALYKSALDCASAVLLCVETGGKGGASWGASGGAPFGALQEMTRRRKRSRAGGASGALGSLLHRACLTHGTTQVRRCAPSPHDGPRRTPSGGASARMAALREQTGLALRARFFLTHAHALRRDELLTAQRGKVLHIARDRDVLRIAAQATLNRVARLLTPCRSWRSRP